MARRAWRARSIFITKSCAARRQRREERWAKTAERQAGGVKGESILLCIFYRIIVSVTDLLVLVAEHG